MVIPTLLASVALVARPSSVDAHVGPSVDANNRYIKVSPLADRVRVAYTVYFGDVPAARIRPTLDRNRDGQLSREEVSPFGQQLAAEIAPGLELRIDGQRYPIEWRTVDVGLGSNAVAAGTFSVDLVAWVCAGGRGDHELTVRDPWPMPHAGETELKVDTGLGISLTRMWIGEVAQLGDDARQDGAPGALGTTGWRMRYTIGDRAPATADGTCTSPGEPNAPAGGPSPLRFVVIALFGAATAAAAAWWMRRRRA